MLFIHHKDDRKATYGKIVCKYKPHKYEKHRSWLTVSGNKIDYPFDVMTWTADITPFKRLVKLVLSTSKARFMSMDIRDFYLETPMKGYEYMFLPFEIIPPKIIDQYNLADKVHSNAKIYIGIWKGMYGLPQAGKIANDQIQ